MDKTIIDQSYWDASYQRIKLVRAEKDDPVRQWVETFLPRSTGSCIEIGCFPGRYLSIFGELGYTLSGIDLTPRVLTDLPEWLRSQGFRTGNFIQRDFFETNLVERFDIVCSFGFIEHFVNYDSVIIRHMQLVKEGGYLVITCPNFSGWLQKALHRLLDKKNVDRHYLPAMNPDKWTDPVQRNGFNILRCGHFGGFDFWVDIQPRNRLQLEVIRLIENNKKILRLLLKKNAAAYSPYCGLIAQREADAILVTRRDADSIPT
jgi:L-malate glycosyltransferase